MLALGYAWGKGQDDEAALREARKEASAEQLEKYRDSLQGNYNYTRGWVVPACAYMARQSSYPYEDGDCQRWPTRVKDLSEFSGLVWGDIKAMCIHVTQRLGTRTADEGRCPKRN